MTSTVDRTDPELVAHQRQHELQNIEFQALLPTGPTSVQLDGEEEEITHNKLPRATLLQKIQVLNWHNASEKKNQLKTVKHFSEIGEFTVTKSTLNRWVLSEKKLRLEYDSLNVGNAKVYKTKPKFKYPEVNRCLEVFYDQSLNENKKYSERFLISKWSEFYKLYHQVDDHVMANLTTKSNGWLHYFKKRSELKKNVTELFYRQRDDQKINSLTQEKLRLRRDLQHYSHRQIYQFDEISIKTDFPFFGMNSSLNDFDDSDTLNALSFINPTKRITVGVLCNALGSNIFPPLIVTDTMVPLNQLAVPHLYWNKNGLMTPEMFHNYLKKLNELLSEPIVILCDNYYPHFVPTTNLSNITLYYFTDSLNQLKYYPMDYGILRLYKVLIKDCILQFFLKKLILGLTSPQDFVFTKIDLIGFIIDSWYQLIRDSHLFVQCFKNSGLLPDDDDEDDDNNNNNNDLLNLYNSKKSLDSASLNSDLSMVDGTTHYDDLKRMFIVKDNSRESQLIGLLKIFNDKNYIRINYTIDSFIFPKDEIVSNFHMTEKDIVLLMKREFEDNSNFFDDENFSNSNNNGGGGVPSLMMPERELDLEDTMEIRELNSALLRKVKPFFDRNQNLESSLQFSRFLNSFTRETNVSFLQSFMGDSNVREKIERKRKRDESISTNDRFLEFQNSGTINHHNNNNVININNNNNDTNINGNTNGNNNDNSFLLEFTDSRVIHSYNFNEFSNDNLQKPQHQQHQQHRHLQQQQHPQQQQQHPQPNSRYVIPYSNFNLPVNHSQFPSQTNTTSINVNNETNGSVMNQAHSNGINSVPTASANDLLVVQQFQQQLQQQQQLLQLQLLLLLRHNRQQRHNN